MAISLDRKLQALRLHNPDARQVFNALREYELNRSEVKVDVLYQKSGVKRSAIRDVFRDLQELGLGELKLGRHGGQTRFVWLEKFKDVLPGPGKGEPVDEALPALTSKGASLVNEWTVKLGPRRVARILIPVNASREDLKTLSAFVQEKLGAGKA